MDQLEQLERALELLKETKQLLEDVTPQEEYGPYGSYYIYNIDKSYDNTLYDINRFLEEITNEEDTANV